MIKDGLSIVIPIYNEQNAISCLLKSLEILQEKITIAFEVILVNDGSTDGTAKGLEKINRDYIRVVHHAANRGYGASLKTGIQMAQYPWLAICDADGTYPIEQLIDLLKYARAEKFDMVVGSRNGKCVQIPLIRRPAKWVLNMLANRLSGNKIPDLNSGMRIMWKNTIKKFIKILPNGFSFTTTITLAMLSNGYRVKYVPIAYFHRVGDSKIQPISDTLNFLQLVCRTVLWFNPLRVYIALSLFFIINAFIVLGASGFLAEKPWDITFSIFIMTGVIILAVGMLADLIDKRMNNYEDIDNKSSSQK